MTTPASPVNHTPVDSFAAVIKVMNAALEHTPPHTRDLLTSGVQVHVQNVDAALRTGGPG